MPKERYFLQLELTLAELSVQLVCPQFPQHYSKMLLIFLHTLGVNKYVVNEDYDKLVQLFHEHLIHEVHKICWCVGESKGHHGELILPVTGDKGGLRDVTFPNLELVVP
jgi:hypothetical protein